MKKMTKQAKKSKKGFTLIELVVVIAILGILAAILIPVIGGFISRANVSADEANAKNIYNTVSMLIATSDIATTGYDTDRDGTTAVPDVEIAASLGGTLGDDLWTNDEFITLFGADGEPTPRTGGDVVITVSSEDIAVIDSVQVGEVTYHAGGSFSYS